MERLFTQEEVNNIVTKRLKQERSREAAKKCVKYIVANHYPTALLDVFPVEDFNVFKDNVEGLVKLFPCILTAPRTTCSNLMVRFSMGLNPVEGGVE